MFRNREKQSTFFDATYICEKLIPEDSFYRKFREIVWPIIRDDEFAPMYCKDNGRPSISPALLAVATILQFHRNLSDRGMEKACMFDIEIKYALGLRLDERPFDHSSLGDFRDMRTGSYQVKLADLHMNITREAVLFELRMSISQDKRSI